MNPKIGIITFHRAVNYGAVFQSVALLRQLEKLGYDAHIVDYRSEILEAPYNECIDTESVSALIFSILQYHTKKLKKENFYKYIVENCKLESIKNISSYDAMITGSDQVWNTEITGIDGQYFLEDCPVAKISYAACTGKSEFPADDTDRVAKLLKNFHAVSVRDKQSYHAVSKVFDGPVFKVIDPTLLLEKSAWDSLCPKVKYNNYILVFAVGFSERLSMFATNLSKKQNKKVIFINANIRKKGKGIYLDTASPGEVLGLIKNADYVVTNSFHGTAMSIALEKDFYVELEHDMKGRNKRVEDMLGEFGINKREIMSADYRDDDFLAINWDKVNIQHDQLRQRSIKFLTDSLP